MKKVLSLIIVLALLVSLPVIAFASDVDYVVDYADVLSESEESRLENKLASYSEELGFDIVVVTVDSYEGKSDMDFADDYYDYNGYAEDGCLLLYNPNEGDEGLYISTKGYGISVVSDYCMKYLSANIKPQIMDGDCYDGFSDYAETIRDFVISDSKGEPFDKSNSYNDFDPNARSTGDKIKTVLICLVVCIIISLVITMGIRNSYLKAVKFNRDARNYLVDGSLNITQAYDNFLYSNVTRVKIQTQSSSGGGTHTSSSGSSHGGGRL